MSSFVRLGVVAATAAIASAAALAGAGAANAQDWLEDEAVLNSPSVMTFTGLSPVGAKGTYKNESGHDLGGCLAYVIPGQYYDELERAMNGDTTASIPDTVAVGVGFIVPDGDSEAGFPDGTTKPFTLGLMPGPSVSLNNAAVLSVCVASDDQYAEIELARVPAGAGGLLGSLSGGLPFGS